MEFELQFSDTRFEVMAAVKIGNRKNVVPEYRGIYLSSAVFTKLWLIPILRYDLHGDAVS